MTLDPFDGWPSAGLPYTFDGSFGAFWGMPVDSTAIEITMYDVTDSTREVAWSEPVAIDPGATGYLGVVRPLAGPGLYRLEVTRGDEVLAWAFTLMEPPCETDCSGG